MCTVPGIHQPLMLRECIDPGKDEYQRQYRFFHNLHFLAIIFEFLAFLLRDFYAKSGTN